MMILSHFKGHPMDIFGSALKSMSIGIASKVGKVYIYAAGDDNLEPAYVINHFPPQTAFTEAMAKAACAVADYYNKKMD